MDSEFLTTPGINLTTLFREVIPNCILRTDSGKSVEGFALKVARCARSLSALALLGKRTTRAPCPLSIGTPGKQPPGSIASGPGKDSRGVGARLEAVEQCSYAPDRPLVAMQHSSVTRLLEPFTTSAPGPPDRPLAIQ